MTVGAITFGFFYNYVEERHRIARDLHDNAALKEVREMISDMKRKCAEHVSEGSGHQCGEAQGPGIFEGGFLCFQ